MCSDFNGNPMHWSAEDKQYKQRIRAEDRNNSHKPHGAKQSFIFAMDAKLACFLRVTFPEHLGQEAVEQVGITDLKFSIY